MTDKGVILSPETFKRFERAVSMVENMRGVRRTGTSICVPPQQQQAPSQASGANLADFSVQSIQNDYLTCYRWNRTTGAVVNTTPIYIAKPDELQYTKWNNWTFKDVQGDEVKAVYSSSTVRTLTNVSTSATETQTITPIWRLPDTGAKNPAGTVTPVAGEIITARQVATGLKAADGTAIGWIDTSPRGWGN